ADRPLASAADVWETIDELSHHLLSLLQRHDFDHRAIPAVISETLRSDKQPCLSLTKVLSYVCTRLVPALRQTSDEIDNLLKGLDGRFVPAGPSGAPTRGMAHVLPTGRNFYAVDPRALPSPAAWHVGQELAREVIQRFKRETGAYPQT